jgi:hypothetical protein
MDCGGEESIDFQRTVVACCCCILLLGKAEQVEERSFFFGGLSAPPSSDSSLFEASMAWPVFVATKSCNRKRKERC